MVEASLMTELSIKDFLIKYSGTHKLSELSRMFGPETRSALSNLEDKKEISYHIDTDTRFSGWTISELPEGYVPSLEPGTLPGKIVKFLQHGPKSKSEIIKQFESDYAASTIRGRLSEIARAGQVLRSGLIYRLKPEDDL